MTYPSLFRDQDESDLESREPPSRLHRPDSGIDRSRDMHGAMGDDQSRNAAHLLRSYSFDGKIGLDIHLLDR